MYYIFIMAYFTVVSVYI